MNWQDRIVIDPNVLVGKPIIKGTRIAALHYASDMMKQEKRYPLTM